MESMVLVGCRVLRRTVSRPTADESQRRERLGASSLIRGVNLPIPGCEKAERGWCGRVESTRRGVLRAPIPSRFAFFVVGSAGGEGLDRERCA